MKSIANSDLSRLTAKLPDVLAIARQSAKGNLKLSNDIRILAGIVAKWNRNPPKNSK